MRLPLPRVCNLLAIKLGLLAAVTVMVGLVVCSKPAESMKDFVFSEAAFKRALAQPYDREFIRGFYQRPRFVPWRQASRLNIPAVRALGEKLFYDTTLANTVGMGCVTCHQPQVAFSDHLPQSAERGRRRSMTLLNLAWNRKFIWTGEVNTLMEQAAFAIEATGGMNTKVADFVERVRRRPDYAPFVKAAYRGTMDPAREISSSSLTYALEIYISSLVSAPSPFDQWIAGDEAAISEEAKKGFDLFNSTARCATCHMSWRFTDGALHDIGLATGTVAGQAQTPSTFQVLEFKTPGLREVGKRWPYMHGGSLDSLTDVLAFYNRGGDVERPSKSKDIQALNLSTQELSALQEFLLTLSAPQ